MPPSFDEEARFDASKTGVPDPSTSPSPSPSPSPPPECNRNAGVSATAADCQNDDDSQNSNDDESNVSPKTKKSGKIYPRRRVMCKIEGCAFQAKTVRDGLCARHQTAKYICVHVGCTNRAQKNGVCQRHGAMPKRCTFEGCTNESIKNGLCWRHGAKEQCSVEGCTNLALRRGVCTRHGAKPKLCKVEGCNNQSKRNGVCVRHGAAHIKCNVEGCTRRVVRGGVCRQHGADDIPGAPPGSRRSYSVDGCTKLARTGGVCIKHGAKNAARKPCIVDGCTNKSQRKGGLCRRHAELEHVNTRDGDERKNNNMNDNNVVGAGSVLLPLSAGANKDVRSTETNKTLTQNGKETMSLIEQDNNGSNESNEHDDPNSSHNHSKNLRMPATVANVGSSPFRHITVPPAPSGKEAKLGLLVEFSDSCDGALIRSIHSNCTFKDEIRIGDRIMTNCDNVVRNYADLKIKGSDGAQRLGIASASCVEVAGSMRKREVCEKAASKEGLCSDNIRPECDFEGCTNRAFRKRRCKRHQEDRQDVSSSGTSKDGDDGPSPEEPPKKRYKKKYKICRHKGCDKMGWVNGLCGPHARLLGKAFKSSYCKIEGCTKRAQTKGVCIAHGGRRPDTETCNHPGCYIVAYKNGVCKAHCGRQVCTMAGCHNFALVRAKIPFCQKHGGYTKYCKVEGCPNQDAGGGVCVRHGAGKNVTNAKMMDAPA